MVARNRAVISGTMGTGGIETWSCGINFGNEGGDLLTTPSELNLWASAIAALFNAMSTSAQPRVHLGNAGAITEIDTYYYGNSGPAQASGNYTFVTPVVGGGSTLSPFQVARVITLRTAFAGRRNRGRIYWPAVGVSVNAAGKAPVNSATATEFATLLRGMGDAAPGLVDLDPVVYSAAGDYLTPVSSISMGDVLDTQRRRTDALVENYTSALIP